MSRDRSARRQGGGRLNRTLAVALALVIFVGVAGQITLLAKLSGQRKAQGQLEKEIRALNAQMENMHLSINSYHNLDRVAARARQLGMDQPDQTQIRVVNLPAVQSDTSTQSAEAIGAEEVN